MPLEVISGVTDFLHTFLQLQISKWSTPLCNKVPWRSYQWSHWASNHFQISTVFFFWTALQDFLSNRHLDESKACHCLVSVKVSCLTCLFHLSSQQSFWEQDSLFNAFRDSRNCLEGSDFNGLQWTSNPMLIAPKVRQIAADHTLFQSFSPHLNEATLPRQLLDSEKSDERTTRLYLLANQLNSWNFYDWLMPVQEELFNFRTGITQICGFATQSFHSGEVRSGQQKDATTFRFNFLDVCFSHAT